MDHSNTDKNMTDMKELTYTRHASRVTGHSPISWTVEYRGIRLINRETKKMLLLPYPEAALWDMITGNIQLERIIPVISAVTHMDKKDTEIWIKNTVSQWEEGNWLV
jgi:hypothetical protein